MIYRHERDRMPCCCFGFSVKQECLADTIRRHSTRADIFDASELCSTMTSSKIIEKEKKNLNRFCFDEQCSSVVRRTIELVLVARM